VSAHTPGPWRAADLAVIVVAETHGYDTMIASYGYGGSSLDQKRANARIGALAPEAIEALEALVAIIDAAGLMNLARGVQLGAISWSVKASDRLEDARRVLAKAAEADATALSAIHAATGEK
jgi:hypothetical protein